MKNIVTIFFVIIEMQRFQRVPLIHVVNLCLRRSVLRNREILIGHEARYEFVVEYFRRNGVNVGFIELYDFLKQSDVTDGYVTIGARRDERRYGNERGM